VNVVSHLQPWNFSEALKDSPSLHHIAIIKLKTGNVSLKLLTEKAEIKIAEIVMKR
jgi:hypothetical protein